MVREDAVVVTHPRARSTRRERQMTGVIASRYWASGGRLRMSLNHMLRRLVKGKGCRDMGGRWLPSSTHRGCRDNHTLLGLVGGRGTGSSASPRARDLDNKTHGGC